MRETQDGKGWETQKGNGNNGDKGVVRDRGASSKKRRK